MSNNVTTYEGFKDEVLNLLYDGYGVPRPKMLTEERLRTAFDSSMSARKYAANVAKELRLVKL